METDVEYTVDNEAAFPGFAPPTQNWSKLPHALIEALPLIETVGEMKCILYILRHTWGYHDTEKRITLDEFCNGRKRRDGTRIDGGTGLSKPTVIDGLERAIIHGFVTLKSDRSDLGRVKNLYSLSQIEVKELDPTGKDSCHRTEKDTSERNLEEKEPAAPDSPPADDSWPEEVVALGEDQQEEESFYKEGETPTAPAVPRTAEQVKAGVQRAIETFGRNGSQRAGVADPTQDDSWMGPAREFSALIVTPNVPENRLKMWAADIQEIVKESETGKGPPEVSAAIRSISMCKDYEWLRSCNRPTHGGFASALLSVLWGQALPEGSRNGGSSGPRKNGRGEPEPDPELQAAYDRIFDEHGNRRPEYR